MTYLASKIGITNITATPSPAVGSGTTTGTVTINGRRHTAYYFLSSGTMTFDKEVMCPVLIVAGGGSGGYGGGYGSFNPHPWWGGGGGGGGYLQTSYLFPANLAVTVSVGGPGGNSYIGHTTVGTKGVNQLVGTTAGGNGGSQSAGGNGGSGGGGSSDSVGAALSGGSGIHSTASPFQGFSQGTGLYYGQGPEGRECSFTATVSSNNILNCSAISSGFLAIGSIVKNSSGNNIGYISSFGTGTGGTGTYYLQARCNVSSISPSTPSAGTARITYGTVSAPLVVGSTVTLSGIVNTSYNGDWTVTASSSSGTADISCSVTASAGDLQTVGTSPRLFGVPVHSIGTAQTMTTYSGQGATWFDGVTRSVGGATGTTYSPQNTAPMAPAHPNASRGGGSGQVTYNATPIAPLTTERGAGGPGGSAYYSGSGNFSTNNYGLAGIGGIIIIAVPS